MILDNLTDLEQSVKPKRTIFQKIAMIIEIGLCIFLGIGIFFKLESFPYASEFLILSMTSLAGLYMVFPIPLFRSSKIWEHILAHLSGFALAIALIGALFRIESWPYASEMQIMAFFLLIPLLIGLSLLIAINFNDNEKRAFYLRIGLRCLILFLVFNFR